MNFRKKHIKIAVLTGLLGIVLVAFFSSSAVSSLRGASLEASIKATLEALNLKGNLEDGAIVYEESCQNCHLPAANGDPAGAYPQLAGQHASVTIKQITDIRA
ncbi:MAG: c-type cytochrome, partial [Deltaproteobacteria bacterium]|nr:c-type cytochrome [Deltaproteobacteria bacterium]